MKLYECRIEPSKQVIGSEFESRPLIVQLQIALCRPSVPCLGPLIGMFPSMRCSGTDLCCFECSVIVLKSGEAVEPLFVLLPRSCRLIIHEPPLK